MRIGDFPIFTNNQNLCYLDSASSTQKPGFVIERVAHYLSSTYANIGRWSYALAEQSDKYYFDTKELIAKLLQCKPNELFFSHNATYCINMIALSLGASGLLLEWWEIILSITEHHANILIRQHVAKVYKLHIKRLGLREDLTFDMSELQQLITTKTAIVCVTLCSNVLGIRNDVRHVRQIIGEQCLLFVDWSQAVPNYPVSVQELDCDFLVFSAHKFLAYTGVWVWYIRHNLISRLTPWVLGWGIVDTVNTITHILKNSIEKFEPWTPNIIGIVSLYYAIRYRESIGGYEWWRSYEKELIRHTLERCQSLSDKLKSITMQQNDRVGIFSFNLWKSDKTLHQIGEYLSKHQICVRVGGHCAYPLSTYLWLSQWSLRVSFYIYNTKDDIDKFFDTLKWYL